jgi:hypothetical protein
MSFSMGRSSIGRQIIVLPAECRDEGAATTLRLPHAISSLRNGLHRKHLRADRSALLAALTAAVLKHS